MYIYDLLCKKNKYGLCLQGFYRVPGLNTDKDCFSKEIFLWNIQNAFSC